MTEYRVVVLPSADLDFRARADFLAARSRTAAVRWAVRTRAALQTLRLLPERCAIAPESEWLNGTLRNLILGKGRHATRILFEVRGESVYVIHIRRGHQDLLGPESWGHLADRGSNRQRDLGLRTGTKSRYIQVTSGERPMTDAAPRSEPLAEFGEITPERLAELKRSGAPLVLTVAGRPALVVQDAEMYGRLRDAAERAGADDFLTKSLADADAGRTRPAIDSLDRIADRYGLTGYGK